MRPTIIRRTTVSIALVISLAVGSWSTPAVGQSLTASSAATVRLTLGVSDPRDRPSQDAIDTFIDQVAIQSGGTITVEPIYEAGSDTPAGGEPGTAGLVANGSLDLGLVASRAWDLAGVTSLQALQAPFLIDNDALAAAVAQSDIATQVMAGLSDVGVTGLTMWPEDLRHPFSFVPGEPLVSPADFQGDVILVQPSAVSRRLVQALGSTVFADDTDRGEAVDAGLLQGAESGLRQGASLPGTPTATGNVTFYPKFQVLVANTRALEALSADGQDAIRQAAAETQRSAVEDHPAERDAAVAWCDAGGAIVMATDDQVAAFAAAAAPVFDEIQSDPAAAAAITAIRSLKETTEPSVGATACGPVPVGSSSPTGSATGASTYGSSTEVSVTDFAVPFTISVPPSWSVVLRHPDLIALNRPIAPGSEWPAIGIDVTVASAVIAEPCEPLVGRAAEVGPSAEDLAVWLGSLEVLGASEPVLQEISGRATWVLDEAFAGAPDCPELQLWDNDGGWIYPQEHKRLHVFEVDGVRMVAVIVAPDETFDQDVAEGVAVLESLRFEGEPAK